MSNLTKRSNLTKTKVKIDKNIKFVAKFKFDKYIKFETNVNFRYILRSYTFPLAPYSLDLVSNFCWTKKKLWETKSRNIWLWKSNSCDLDAKLAIWATSRWKLLMKCSRRFTVQQILTIHIVNKSICHIYRIMPQSGQNCSSWTELLQMYCNFKCKECNIRFV